MSESNKRKSGAKRSNQTNSRSGRSSRKGRGSGYNRNRESASVKANDNRYELYFVLVTVFSILLYLSYAGIAGVVGRGLSTVFFGLFGWGAYILPLYGVIFALFYMANIGNKQVIRRLWCTIGLFISFTSFLQLINYGNCRKLSYADIFTECAKNRNGGGFIGGSLAKGLASVLALAGAYVVVIAAFIIFLILVTDRLITNAVRKRAKRAKEEFARRAELRNERNEIDEQFKINQREEEFELRKKEMAEKRKEELAEEARKRKEGKAKKEAEKKEREEKQKNKEDETKQTGAPLNDTDMKEITKNGGQAEVDTAEKDSLLSDFIERALNDKFGQKGDKEEKAEEVLPEDKSTEAEAEPEKVVSKPASETNEPVEAKTAEPVKLESTRPETPKQEKIPIEDVLKKQDEDDEINPTFNKSSDSTTIEEAETDDETTVEKDSGKLPETKAAVSVTTTSEDEETVIEKKPYIFPDASLLTEPKEQKGADREELMATAKTLQETLKSFGVNVKVTDVSCGPAVTRFELHPEQGVKVSRITALADDIKLNLAASDIRIEAPIPGKAAVGIEVPNKENSVVYFRELIESEKFKDSKSRVSFAVGKDIAGQVVITDIAKMPHLLIAGATGSGKSVCINTLIMSILYKAEPDEVRFIMIDPKVVELSVYNGIPHLLMPVVTDPKKAAGALAWAVAEMSRRYKEFADKSVREIKGYNAKVGEDSPLFMPQIVIIVDELADLMMVSGKEVEESICRLAQLARAAGIHLVIATQRPSVNVITGLIKANIPSRIAFQVSSQVDSRTILDGAGAEKLLGKGDMLFAPANLPKPVRVQGAFVSDGEVGKVVDFIKENNAAPDEDKSIEKQVEEAASKAAKESSSSKKNEADEPDDGYDELFDKAGALIIDKKKASIGMLQRVYRIGFNRAARIMDQLADAGVVSEEDGTKPRNILMRRAEFDALVNARHGVNSADGSINESDDEAM